MDKLTPSNSYQQKKSKFIIEYRVYTQDKEIPSKNYIEVYT